MLGTPCIAATPPDGNRPVGPTRIVRVNGDCGWDSSSSQCAPSRLSERASWDDVPIRHYAVAYKGHGPSFRISWRIPQLLGSSESVLGYTYVPQGQQSM